MEPDSLADANQPISISTLEGQLREVYGRAAYTQKTHEKMADGYVAKYRWIKRVEIALSALTSGSLLVAVFSDSQIGTITGAALSTILLGITLYFKEATLGELAQQHGLVASKLWGVREALLSLLVDVRDGRSAEEIRTQRDGLTARLQRIYRAAPRTDSTAYAAAQRALKHHEELFFTDEELDRMLPARLRSQPVRTGPDVNPAA